MLLFGILEKTFQSSPSSSSPSARESFIVHQKSWPVSSRSSLVRFPKPLASWQLGNLTMSLYNCLLLFKEFCDFDLILQLCFFACLLKTCQTARSLAGRAEEQSNMEEQRGSWGLSPGSWWCLMEMGRNGRGKSHSRALGKFGNLNFRVCFWKVIDYPIWRKEITLIFRILNVYDDTIAGWQLADYPAMSFIFVRWHPSTNKNPNANKLS